MATINGQQFNNTAVVLDGNTYDGCSFEQCVLVYRGGDLPRLFNNKINNCQFRFEESADRTIFFLQSITRDMGANAKPFIERTFALA